jgi:hypothetical protein
MLLRAADPQFWLSERSSELTLKLLQLDSRYCVRPQEKQRRLHSP